MNWDTLIRQFANYLRLERSLSDNSIQAYVRDVAKLKQFVDISNLDVNPERVTSDQIQSFLKYSPLILNKDPLKIHCKS